MTLSDKILFWTMTIILCEWTLNRDQGQKHQAMVQEISTETTHFHLKI